MQTVTQTTASQVEQAAQAARGAADAAAQAALAAQDAAIAGTASTSAQANYEAARAARNELKSQLDALVSQRHGFLRELEDHQVPGPATTGMQTRISQLDARIAQLDIDIAKADAAVANAAAVPGAVVESPPGPFRNGPPEEVLILVPILAFVLFLPIVITIARGLWRRGSRTGSSQPQISSDLVERLARLEAMGETTALEVERIGEGQRFVTRLLTDRADHVLANQSGGEAGRR
jgi:hypothetical protein